MASNDGLITFYIIHTSPWTLGNKDNNTHLYINTCLHTWIHSMKSRFPHLYYSWFFYNEKHIKIICKLYSTEAYFSIWSFKNREPKTLKSECKPWRKWTSLAKILKEIFVLKKKFHYPIFPNETLPSSKESQYSMTIPKITERESRFLYKIQMCLNISGKTLLLPGLYASFY